MNKKLQFLNKRDSNGSLLMLSARDLSYEIAEKSFDKIKDYPAYSVLIKYASEKYVEMYYKRMFYEYSKEASSQIVIHDYDNINSTNTYTSRQQIDLGRFPCASLLREVLHRSDIYYNRSISYYYGLIKKKIKSHYIFFSKFLINLINHSKTVYCDTNNNLTKNIVGVKYAEGLDIKKRSDIAWLPNSNIDPKTVLIYFERKNDFAKYSNVTVDINEYGVRFIKLWKWQNRNEGFFDNLYNELGALRASDSIEKWLIKSAINLVKDLNYWYSFFSEFNISITVDPIESGLDAITKQIAINKMGGLSFGKLRSYPYNRVDFAYSMFPNDVFFVWGVQSANNIKNTINNIDNIVISGFPYDSGLLKVDKDLININNALHKKKTKFNILIVDSNHGLNLGLHQDIYTPVMVKFYKSLLKWVTEDAEIGMIIKPKKIDFFNNLQSVKSYYNNVSSETGRCHLINEPFQKMASSYADSIDLVVSISFNLPSTLIECVSFGKRGVIFDSTNIHSFEKKLYEWGENKVIFSDLNNMLRVVKSYKNNPSNMPEIGDWSSYLNDIDPFHDSKGPIRIGNYLQLVQEGLQKGLTRDDAIIYSNKKFSETWGPDKIVRCLNN